MLPETQNEVSVETTLQTIIDCLEDSKAEAIIPINIANKSALGDYMVIASGRSNRHVSALADHLLKTLKENGISNVRTEGLAAGDWVLIDSGNVIIHLFQPEIREFYNLEKMWLTQENDEATQTAKRNN